jgi:hypothetical protein
MYQNIVNMHDSLNNEVNSHRCVKCRFLHLRQHYTLIMNINIYWIVVTALLSVTTHRHCIITIKQSLHSLQYRLPKCFIRKFFLHCLKLLLSQKQSCSLHVNITATHSAATNADKPLCLDIYFAVCSTEMRETKKKKDFGIRKDWGLLPKT